MIPELKIFLIALSPFVGLQGSIPVALGIYHLPLWLTFLVSVLGSLVPVVVLLKLLGPISDYFSHHFYFCNRFFAWLFARTRKKHTRKFQRWKEFALVILVAFSGAWTGSLCAFVFGIPFKRAFLLIALGVIIAGLIVTLISLGILKTI